MGVLIVVIAYAVQARRVPSVRAACGAAHRGARGRDPARQQHQGPGLRPQGWAADVAHSLRQGGGDPRLPRPPAGGLRRRRRPDGLPHRPARVRARLPQRRSPPSGSGATSPRTRRRGASTPSSSGRRASTSSSGCSTRQGSFSVPEEHRPFRASYLVSGIGAERIFAALLDVRRFPEWAAGLKRSRALDAATGAETTDLRPGVRLEFTLNAAGITHDVASTVTVVEPPRRLRVGLRGGRHGKRRLAHRGGGGRDRQDDAMDRLQDQTGLARQDSPQALLPPPGGET